MLKIWLRPLTRSAMTSSPMLSRICATDGVVISGKAGVWTRLATSGRVADGVGMAGVDSRLANLLRPLTPLFAGSVARVARAAVFVTATVVELVSCITD